MTQAAAIENLLAEAERHEADAGNFNRDVANALVLAAAYLRQAHSLITGSTNPFVVESDNHSSRELLFSANAHLRRWKGKMIEVQHAVGLPDTPLEIVVDRVRALRVGAQMAATALVSIDLYHPSTCAKVGAGLQGDATATACTCEVRKVEDALEQLAAAGIEPGPPAPAATIEVDGVVYGENMIRELRMSRDAIQQAATALAAAPPHHHTDGRCCNPECRGQWGTGCYCCHHGRYHPVLAALAAAGVQPKEKQ